MMPISDAGFIELPLAITRAKRFRSVNDILCRQAARSQLASNVIDELQHRCAEKETVIMLVNEISLGAVTHMA